MEQSKKDLSFDEDELMIIREALSSIACGHERLTYMFHCCDYNDIISKIDDCLCLPNESDGAVQNN